jgi:DNA-damage-inducible protein J
MTANALVQTRIDADLKDRASEVLGALGLTVSDAVRMLLTRVALEGALPFEMVADTAAHDAWFKSKVEAALNDLRPALSHDEAEQHMAERRAKALNRFKSE